MKLRFGLAEHRAQRSLATFGLGENLCQKVLLQSCFTAGETKAKCGGVISLMSYSQQRVEAGLS